MRAGVVLLAIGLALAGCGAPPEPAPTLPVTEGPFLDVWVTDEEWVSIAGALVFVDGRPQEAITDDLGTVRLDGAPGRFVVKAWAPGYYRNATKGEAGPNGAVEVHVVLERRPPDRLTGVWEFDEGYCWLGVRSPLSEGRTAAASCLGSPANRPPAPEGFVSFSLHKAWQNLTVHLAWEDSSVVPQQIAFELELRVPCLEETQDPRCRGRFADGSEVRMIQGASPLTYELRASDVDAGVLWNETTVIIGSEAAPDELSPIVSDQPFSMEAYIVQFFQAPPAEPW